MSFESIQIGFDVMAGDNAENSNIGPQFNIEASEQVRLQLKKKGVELVYAGQEKVIQKALFDIHGNNNHVPEILNAPQVITMNSKVDRDTLKSNNQMNALRDALKNNTIQGALSLGNTGAWGAIASQLRNKVTKIRPAIGVSFPRMQPLKNGYSLLLDGGFDAKDIDPTPERYLEQFLLASEYQKSMYGIETPIFGIASYGTEISKGTDNQKHAIEMFKQLIADNVISAELFDEGFVEPKHEFSTGEETVDIILADGRTGNMLLKQAEATSKLLRAALQEAFSSPWNKTVMATGPYWSLKKTMEPYQTRSNPVMPLLGLGKKVITIGHGSSEQITIQNGLLRTADLTKKIKASPETNDSICEIRAKAQEILQCM